MKVYADQLWFIFGLFFLILGIVTGLGEWVFHWWDQPWDVGSPVSLFIGVFGLLWSASGHEMRHGFHDMRGGLAGLHEGQREQTELLWEMRQGQQGQATREGQAEQTSLLRELVDSFRRRE